MKPIINALHRAYKRNRKRAISELVAYAMLIGFGITLSVIVYNWMRIYVMPSAQIKACPTGVSIILDSYTCLNKKMNLTVMNKGLFKIDGYLVKVNNKTDQSGNPVGLPYLLLDIVGVQLSPGQQYRKEWNYKTPQDYVRIVQVEIEPFRKEGGKQIYCGAATIRQNINPLDCS